MNWIMNKGRAKEWCSGGSKACQGGELGASKPDASDGESLLAEQENRIRE